MPIEYSKFWISEYDNKRDSKTVNPVDFFEKRFITLTVVKGARKEMTYNFAKKEHIWMVDVHDSSLPDLKSYQLWRSDTGHLCCPSQGDGWTRYLHG